MLPLLSYNQCKTCHAFLSTLDSLLRVAWSHACTALLSTEVQNAALGERRALNDTGEQLPQPVMLIV
jgi:hypothetical protein